MKLKAGSLKTETKWTHPIARPTQGGGEEGSQIKSEMKGEIFQLIPQKCKWSQETPTRHYLKKTGDTMEMDKFLETYYIPRPNPQEIQNRNRQSTHTSWSQLSEAS